MMWTNKLVLGNISGFTERVIRNAQMYRGNQSKLETTLEMFNR
jgi:hypothetical protein